MTCGGSVVLLQVLGFSSIKKTDSNNWDIVECGVNRIRKYNSFMSCFSPSRYFCVVPIRQIYMYELYILTTYFRVTYICVWFLKHWKWSFTCMCHINDVENFSCVVIIDKKSVCLNSYYCEKFLLKLILLCTHSLYGYVLNHICCDQIIILYLRG